VKAADLFTKIYISSFTDLGEKLLDGAISFVDGTAVLLLGPKEVPGPLKRLECAHLVT
jgi:hypothetical protein